MCHLRRTTIARENRKGRRCCSCGKPATATIGLTGQAEERDYCAPCANATFSALVREANAKFARNFD